jgi:hypothetical protein
MHNEMHQDLPDNCLKLFQPFVILKDQFMDMFLNQIIVPVKL